MKIGTEHVAYVCTVEHHDGEWTCQFCNGGLFSCTECGSFEGATTTHCPGYRMSEQTCDWVYDGSVDYRWGKWIDRPSRISPGWWRKHANRLHLVENYNDGSSVFGRKVKR